ncbi:LEAF RUST 10 DISEASE-RESISTANCEUS RECEPTOR-LIKE PROTEIN KINASE-like 2.4 isoform X1 [Elaeis guineensis]|uniref:LEAF RUST 10 DISEASE-RESISTANCEUS RECEPTOR-LIKE PROTEIN KINASE-like 2.4 isoform X1 n=1 Tax=Elaeis guineensis var. tenera TaxID=51953 RepID=UPI003C6CFBF0
MRPLPTMCLSSLFPSSSQLLLFILHFLALSSLPPSFSETSYHQYIDCTPTPYTCGAIRFNMAFPFRIAERRDYCGYPGFDLACTNSTLMIHVNNKGYQVKNIDYMNHLLTIVDADFVQQSCPQPHESTIINLDLFEYTDADGNLTLYNNCTSFPSTSTLHGVDCSSNTSNRHSYYKLGNDSTSDLSTECSSTAVIPIDVKAADGLVNGDLSFREAVQEGFSLKWTVGSGWCSGCTDSGGICGYSDNSPDEHTCFCSDDKMLDSCSSSDREVDISTTELILLGSIAMITAGLLFSCYFFLFSLHRHRNLIIFWRSKSNSAQNIEALMESYGSLAPKRYKYTDLKKMTNSFRDKLGQGGYGIVYKGSLQGGRLVAVKFLRNSRGDGEEFVNEVVSIGRTSHVNIVSLIGFCLEGSKRALIYDYMPNGSLEKYIYSEKPKTTLGWEKLYEIAIGIARGLEYLHRGCNTRIVHFDIKPHNILLDQEFCPKIADFGLAKLCPPKDSILSVTCARGTIAFIAPEVFSRNFGVVSTKSDVYSYGMMVLEMVGGRKNVKASVENTSEIYFPHWIYDHLDHVGDLQAFELTTESEEFARKMILVGLWCIQMMPGNRPPMSRVVDMLEGSINDLQTPPKPYICSPSHSFRAAPNPTS